MKRSDIRRIVNEELTNIFAEDKDKEPKVDKATKSDETKLRQAFASMAKRPAELRINNKLLLK